MLIINNYVYSNEIENLLIKCLKEIIFFAFQNKMRKFQSNVQIKYWIMQLKMMAIIIQTEDNAENTI